MASSKEKQENALQDFFKGLWLPTRTVCVILRALQHLAPISHLQKFLDF